MTERTLESRGGGRKSFAGCESMTKQSFKDECDIHTILRKYNQGTIDIPSLNPPRYGDFSNVEDYLTQMNRLTEAQEAFDALPANIRTRFQNDPGKLLEFIGDDENRDEAVKLGLVEKQEKTMPDPPTPAEGGGEEPPKTDG